MRLTLTRRWRDRDATMGTLTADGIPLCFSLEDVVRAHDDDADGEIDADEVARVKVPGATAIPAGIYRVTMHDSPKFGRVPKLHDVPGFTDIYFHAGNTAKDTKGCILVGLGRRPAALEHSKRALVEVIKVIEAAEDAAEEITCEIREAFAEATA